MEQLPLRGIRPCAADEVTAVEACCYLGIRWGQWVTQAHAFHAFRRKAKWLPEPRVGTIYSRYAIYALSDICCVAWNGTFRKHGPIGTLPVGRLEARSPVFSAPDHAMLVQLCDAEIRRLVKDEDMRQTIWMQIVETDVVGKYEMSDRRIPFLSYLKAAVWHRLQNQRRGMSRALAREACVDLVVDLPDVADRRQNQEPIVDARMFVRKLDDLPRKDRDGLLARLDDDDSDGLSRVLRRAFPTVTARRPIEERLSAWLPPPPGEELSPNG